MGLLLIEYLASPYWAGITRAKLRALVLTCDNGADKLPRPWIFLVLSVLQRYVSLHVLHPQNR